MRKEGSAGAVVNVERGKPEFIETEHRAAGNRSYLESLIVVWNVSRYSCMSEKTRSG